MPIEIRELVIRAIVEPAETQTQSSDGNQQEESEQILSDSLEQVMDYFKNKNER